MINHRQPHMLAGMLLISILIGFGSCKPPAEADPKIGLVSRLQDASQLATVEFVIDKIVVGNKKNTLWGFEIGESNFLAETEARVKAGIDLSKITSNDISINGKQVILRLPPVEILNFSYPAEKFKVNKEFTGSIGFAELTAEDMDNFYQLGELTIRKDLHFLGIDEEARKKTRQFMTRLLKQMGYEEVVIEFETAVLIDLPEIERQLNRLREKINESE